MLHFEVVPSERSRAGKVLGTRLGLTMVPRKNKNNAYAKFGGTNKEYYGIFGNGLKMKYLSFLVLYLVWLRSNKILFCL